MFAVVVRGPQRRPRLLAQETFGPPGLPIRRLSDTFKILSCILKCPLVRSILTIHQSGEAEVVMQLGTALGETSERSKLLKRRTRSLKGIFLPQIPLLSTDLTVVSSPDRSLKPLQIYFSWFTMATTSEPRPFGQLDIDDILSKLTLQEGVSLLAGLDMVCYLPVQFPCCQTSHWDVRLSFSSGIQPPFHV